MGRIVIELTNRCNLRCRHCYEGRHGGNAELSLAVLDEILHDAKRHGFDELAFTGGEPTTHRQFFDVIGHATEHGYRFGFVSNGWNFPKIYQRLLPFRDWLTSITFSLDGATEVTHDNLRGKGSFRRLLKAMSICVAKDIPFSINTVVTNLNCDQLDELVALAIPLGSQGIRFGHYIESGREDSIGLRLTDDARRRIEANIWQLRDEAPIPVAMAPGYVTDELFPCAPLNLEEFNIDWQGNVGKCCHLSGFDEASPASDIAGNLNDISFTEAVNRLKRENDTFRRHKVVDRRSGAFRNVDFSPCEYCCKHYRKGRFVQSTEPVAVDIHSPNRHDHWNNRSST
jgi:MoaA/NifB/PqqE/SkfB family radical SAM enzyme